ncbi:MAG: glucose-6-phosphate isomerase [Microbacteriaceae bacterium]|nr:glucose-6-phosphate isomerase [Microbacteriaceae bacterium]
MSVKVDFAAGSAGEQAAFARALERLLAAKFASRLAAQDNTLWGPEAEAEAAIRLGWVDFAGHARETLSRAISVREELRTTGVREIVLCGMGGSSLAPELICAHERLPFTSLDSTHPDQIRETVGRDLSRVAVVVSSKSGTTVETTSHLDSFIAAFEAQGIDPTERIILVTDPGSAMDERAAKEGFRVFHGDPNVGGRFSALTAFGIVPSGLAGVDFEPILDGAQAAREQVSHDHANNPALILAAALFAGLPQKYVAFVGSRTLEFAGFGLWVEQLIAESSGKYGTGVLPIALPLEAPELQAEQLPANSMRVWVTDAADTRPAAELTVRADLGAQLFVWEAATAALGFLLGTNPFDQPDVESAKVAARAQLLQTAPVAQNSANDAADTPEIKVLTPENASNDPAEAFAAFESQLRKNAEETSPIPYVAVQVYAARTPQSEFTLELLRADLAERFGCPVTASFGPRYLHSTGQFHKGGTPAGHFLQIFVPPKADQMLDTPGVSHSYGDLVLAQMRGDGEVLAEHGRPLLAFQARSLTGFATAVARF